MRRLLLIITAVLIANRAFAQLDAPVKWACAAKKLNNKEAVVFIKATIQPGWHVYAQNLKEAKPLSTVFTFDASSNFKLLGSTSEPKGISKYQSAIKMNVTYFENSVTFQQKITLRGGKTTVTGKLEYVACNSFKCLPREEEAFSIPVI